MQACVCVYVRICLSARQTATDVLWWEGQLAQTEAESIFTLTAGTSVRHTWAALSIPSMHRTHFPKHYCSIMPLDISATLWPLLVPQWCYIYSCSTIIPAFFLPHSVIAHWPLPFDEEFSFVIMSGTAHWFDLARLPYTQIASLGNRGMKEWSHFSHSAALYVPVCSCPVMTVWRLNYTGMLYDWL